MRMKLAQVLAVKLARLGRRVFLFHPRKERLEGGAVEHLAAHGVAFSRSREKPRQPSSASLPGNGHGRLLSSASTPGSRTSAQAEVSVTPAQLVARRDAGPQRVGELVLAAGRLLQARGELEDAGLEQVDAGVVEGVGRGHGALFHEVDHEAFAVEHDGAALGQVLAILYRDHAVLAEGLRQPRVVGGRLDQDVAVGEEEAIGANPVTRELRRLACAVLHLLLAVSDAEAERGAVAEVVCDDVAAPADDDEEVAHAGRVAQALDDVLQDRLALDLLHRFRNVGGELAHARAPCPRRE